MNDRLPAFDKAPTSQQLRRRALAIQNGGGRTADGDVCSYPGCDRLVGAKGFAERRCDGHVGAAGP